MDLTVKVSGGAAGGSWYKVDIVFVLQYAVIKYQKQVGRVGRPDQYWCKLLYVTVILEPSYSPQINSK